MSLRSEFVLFASQNEANIRSLCHHCGISLPLGTIGFVYGLKKGHPVFERCFCRLKEYRHIATRYDKTARSYLMMVKLGCIRLF